MSNFFIDKTDPHIAEILRASKTSKQDSPQDGDSGTTYIEQ